jgi:hypothetical protein
VDNVTVVQQVSKVITVGESGGSVNVTQQQVVKVVTVAEQGPPGRDGTDGVDGISGEYTAYITKTANSNLSGHRVVMVVGDELVDYADKEVVTNSNKVLGITLNASSQGDVINVQTGGELEEPTWNWNLNTPIYLGNSGYLTQVIPTAGFILQVAIPVSSTKINVNIKQPIILV